MIYHVVTEDNWKASLVQSFYEAQSLSSEGFIHCSKKEQVKGVLERYYKDQTNLLLLHIDKSKLDAALNTNWLHLLIKNFHIFMAGLIWMQLWK
jgi:uncharacterized protein (DUF952 family)